MTVKELSREQLSQLKLSYYMGAEDDNGEGVSWGECAEINDLVSDDEIFEFFGETVFADDDFFVTAS